jgi:hypothetical protein
MTRKQLTARLTAAFHAVGETPERQLEWLMALSRGEGLDDLRSRADEISYFLFKRRDQPGNLQSEGLPFGSVSAAMVPAIVQKLTEALKELRTRGAYIIPQLEEHQLVWYLPGRQGPWIMRSGPIPDIFLAEVADLLAEVGEALRLCDAPDCGRLFVARRPHQVRCSARCTNRVNTARYRERRPHNVQTRRRTRYERQIRSDPNLKNAKIARRALGEAG